MVTKGIGDIKSLHTLNTRPGPLTEQGVLLRLYKLATQKANFQKKKEWAERQRTQAIRHLIDVQREIGSLKKVAMEKIGKYSTRGKAEAIKARTGKRWSEVSLKY